MIVTYALFLVPLVLFVLAFLYETLLSFLRLRNPESGRAGYVHSTWEITHTLLVFALVVMLMLFTKSIDELAAAIFMPAFLAVLALTVRSICYIYIFYVRTNPKQTIVDWIFAISHVVAALFLVATAAKALWFLFENQPEANTQFVPVFGFGLIFVIGICITPIIFLYTSKKGNY